MALQGIAAPVKQKKSGGGIGQVLGTLAGAGVGLIAGGPAGAMAGASLGGSLGGTVGSMVAPGGQEQAGQTNVLQRRQEAMERDDLRVLRDAQQALPELPPDIQQQVAEPLRMAQMRIEEQRRRGA